MKSFSETKLMRRERVILKNISMGQKIFEKFPLGSLYGGGGLDFSNGIRQHDLTDDIN